MVRVDLDPAAASWIYRNNPVRFANEVLGFAPDANQERVLRVDAQRVILACHRQFGKSTTAAVKAVHHAFHSPDSTTIIVAPTLRQGGLLLDTIHRFARKLDLEINPDKYNRPALVLPNGARVVAVPSEEHNIRGFSAVSLLLIDEAARVPDEVWSAVLPMVSTVDGAVWLMSTPAGKQGFFADMWFNGDAKWNRIRATADQSTRISASVLDDQRNSLSKRQFAQDYMCEFGDFEDQVFRTAAVEQAFKKDIQPITITRGWRQDFHHPRATDYGFYIGLDLAKSHDYTAIAILELHTWENGWVNAATLERLTDTTLRLRHLERMKDKPYTEILNRLTEIVNFLGQRHRTRRALHRLPPRLDTPPPQRRAESPSVRNPRARQPIQATWILAPGHHHRERNRGLHRQGRLQRPEGRPDRNARPGVRSGPPRNLGQPRRSRNAEGRTPQPPPQRQYL
jgi:hypothetical protein